MRTIRQRSPLPTRIVKQQHGGRLRRVECMSRRRSMRQAARARRCGHRHRPSSARASRAGTPATVARPHQLVGLVCRQACARHTPSLAAATGSASPSARAGRRRSRPRRQLHRDQRARFEERGAWQARCAWQSALGGFGGAQVSHCLCGRVPGASSMVHAPACRRVSGKSSSSSLPSAPTQAATGCACARQPASIRDADTAATGWPGGGPTTPHSTTQAQRPLGEGAAGHSPRSPPAATAGRTHQPAEHRSRYPSGVAVRRIIRCEQIARARQIAATTGDSQVLRLV